MVSIHAPAWGATSVRGGGQKDLLQFQSTHPRGVRRYKVYYGGRGGGFQSTHPRGVRRRPSGQGPTTSACFNPRTRVGCDHWLHHMPIGSSRFQSTHPRGVRRAIRTGISLSQTQFQTTHPRGVRLGRCNDCRAPGYVSIHAPAWGATWIWYQYGIRFEMFQSTHPRGVRHAGHGRIPCAGPVSIHAPAWGATTPSGRPLAPGTGFQSTHPRGVRLALPLDHDRLALVSIHAPAWGATSQRPKGGQRSRVSIHAPAWGATCPCEVRRLAKSLFQSTHPRGVRLGISPSGFNATGVSIHAPAWGATGRVVGVPHDIDVSIHAPAWGATARSARARRGAGSFNPRTRVGCDIVVDADFEDQAEVSIHAPAWGATCRSRCAA